MTWASRTAVLLVIIVAGTTLRGDAQSLAEIRGTVTDETGGAIVGASVTLTDRRRVPNSTSTNQEGVYQFAAVAPGMTTLEIRAAGFALASRTVQVPTTGITTVDVELRVAIKERVDVREGLNRISLDSDQNLSAIRLSTKILEALPDDPESLLHALRQLAATTGTRADLVTVYVDGMPVDRRLPPKDIIQSIRINANPFSAEFGEPGASRIEILTKPASQHFHGHGRFDFNDAALNARNLFEPVRARYQFRTYEGYIGGPVVPNRWGFLLYGGLWEQDDNIVVNATPVDPVTFQPEALRLNIAAPTRTSSYSLKTDGQVTRNNTVGVEYARNDQRRRNAGLYSGFDLPERAYTGDSDDQSASLWVTSISSSVLNELRARASRNRGVDRAVTVAPAIVVPEAFSAGGNQDLLFRDNNTERARLANVLTFGSSTHSVRIGAQADIVRLSQVDRANFNGTFIFGSDVMRDELGNPLPSANGEPSLISGLDLYRQVLAGAPGYLPSQFSIVRGDPSVTFSVIEGAWFAQDDWRPGPHLTVSYGLRHEYQESVDRRMQIAPRAGFAWAPSGDGSSAVRGGAGLFFSQIPHGLFSDVRRLDGLHGQRFVIDRPTFFPTVPQTLPGVQNLVSTNRTQAQNLTFPTTLLTSISYDRRLAWGLFGSIGYSWRRGTHLLRTRKIDVPIEDAAQAGALTLQFESTGRSSTHDLNATVNGNLGPYFTVFGSYGHSRALQDTDDLYSAPADSSNLAAEWGAASLPRHRFALGGSIDLPDDFAIYPFVTVTSALPFNITTGSDNNGDSVFTDRPALAEAGSNGAVVTPFGVFNPSPRAAEAVIPRNFGMGQAQFTFDITFSKAFMSYTGVTPSSRRTTITLSITNLTNHVNYAPFNGVLTSPFFGTANRALNPRRIILSARYDF